MENKYVLHMYGGYYIAIIGDTLRTNTNIDKATKVTKDEADILKEEIENKFDLKVTVETIE